MMTQQPLLGDRKRRPGDVMRCVEWVGKSDTRADVVGARCRAPVVSTSFARELDDVIDTVLLRR